ncbi:MAG TPA: carboxypeptidase-like regulatory domain-containing protein, partial [Flavisolibacter sp.]|nr:carboxypeptidase-like regulatory domain-containing protein [Flavisolibacter sp.]
MLLILLFTIDAAAQRKTATVSGRVLDENEHPLSNVSVMVLGQQNGVNTNDSGIFRLRVPADRAIALVFSFTGYRTVQQNFLLSEGEQETITIRMETGGNTLQEVVVSDQRSRTEAGLIRPNPKSVLNLPSPVTGVENLIKIFVGSNNELT